jgi:CBS-domain-containing membrane protein
MLERAVSGLPVVDGVGALLGMITEGDLLRRTELGSGIAERSLIAATDKNAALRAYIKSNAWSVADVMSTPAIAVADVTPVDEIASTMLNKSIKRVPVLSEGRLVGIVSRADLLRVIAWVEPERAILGDEALCRSVKARLSVQGLLTDRPELTVSNCVVHLWSGNLTQAERDVIRITAEGTPGTAGFVDHLASDVGATPPNAH